MSEREQRRAPRIAVSIPTVVEKTGARQVPLHPILIPIYERVQPDMSDVGLKFQILVKTKIPAIQIADLHRDQQDEEDFVRTAVGVLRAIDRGISYPVRGWACRGCPYAHACRGAGS